MTESGRRLGLTVTHVGEQAGPVRVQSVSTNTRTALWPERWPAIALQECIDAVEAAPEDEKSIVKFGLPCQDCPEASRCLNAKRKEIGPLLYDREILTNPRSSESSLFPRSVFLPMLQPLESLVPYWHKPFGVEHEYKVAQAWDLAWSEKIGGDYLVCATGVVHLPTGERTLLCLERWQRLTFKQQCELIELRWRQFNADAVVIEADAAQQIWGRHMADTTPVPVVRHTAGGGGKDASKNDLFAGVPGLLIKFENRKWRLPYRQGGYLHEEIENMLTEFEALGWVDGSVQGVGEHDDTVLAFWHLDWGLDRWIAGAGGEYHRGNVPGVR